MLLLLLLAADPAFEPASQAASAQASSLQTEALLEPGAMVAQPDFASSAPAQNQPTTSKPSRRTAVSAAVNPDQAALSANTKKRWSLNASFTTSFGLATFLRDPNAARYVGSNLLLAPAYVFRAKNGFAVRASVQGSLSWEYTTPNDPVGRRFDWSDLVLGASARAYTIPRVNVDLWASYRMPAPISLSSIQAGLVTALIPGVGASRNFNFNVRPGWSMGITLRYDFVFRKNLHLTTVPRFAPQPEDVRDPSVLTRSSDVLTGGGVARGGASTDFTFTNGVTLAWSPIEVLSLTVFAAITNGFTYAIADQRDAYTSPFASAGAGRFDSLRTNIDLTWVARPELLVSAGVFTSQPPFRANNLGLYNPFFNVEAAASNYTSLYLSLTALL